MATENPIELKKRCKLNMFFPLYKYLQVYNKNKEELDLVFKKRNMDCIENFESRDTYISGDEKLYLGMTAGIFMFVLIIQMIIFITAIVLLVKNWDRLNTVAQIFGILFIFWTPIVTIIICLFLRRKVYGFI
jgi:hypothetical protein